MTAEEVLKKHFPYLEKKWIPRLTAAMKEYANEQVKIEHIKGNIFAEWCSHKFRYPDRDIIANERNSPEYLVFEHSRLKEILTEKTETK